MWFIYDKSASNGCTCTSWIELIVLIEQLVGTCDAGSVHTLEGANTLRRRAHSDAHTHAALLSH